MRDEVRGIYQQFVGRVAEGRGLDAKRVNELGRGRVWTGAQAKDSGLVDTLGGLREAVAEAKGLVGLAPDADVVLVPFPPPKPLVEQVRDAFQVAVAARAETLALGALPRGARATLGALLELPAGAPLLIPPLFAEVH
jgi:protease-4